MHKSQRVAIGKGQVLGLKGSAKIRMGGSPIVDAMVRDLIPSLGSGRPEESQKEPKRA